jgi:hypothetical protein
MPDITVVNSNPIAPVQDPFMAEANRDGVSHGTILKFSKGEWSANDKEIAIGTEFVAHITDAAKGWVKWEGGKPVNHVIGYVRDRFEFPPRDTLGDTDEDLWETGKDGMAKDPWSQQ